MNRKKTGSLLFLFLAVQLLMAGTAIAAPIDRANEEKRKAQEQLERVRKEIRDLERSKELVLSEITEMDEKLSSLLITIHVLKEDIADKKGEVARARAEYRDAYSRERKQYDAMKKRIRYVYERGDTSYLDILLKSRSLTDAITESEYMSRLYDYDRTMFLNYKSVKEEVGLRERKLEEEEAEMEVMEEEYRSEMEALERSVKLKKESVENFEEKLKQANSKAEEYARTVKEQTERWKELKEAQAKAKEAREKNKNRIPDQIAENRLEDSYGRRTDGSIKSTGGTERGREIADYALQFVGNPYVWGGTSLTKGADCSGFTQSVYRHFGISLPRTSAEQSKYGKKVKFEDLQPGDLVFYAGHVAIYIGEGRIVHASSRKEGIKVGNDVTYRTILDLRRPWAAGE